LRGNAPSKAFFFQGTEGFSEGGLVFPPGTGPFAVSFRSNETYKSRVRWLYAWGRPLGVTHRRRWLCVPSLTIPLSDSSLQRWIPFPRAFTGAYPREEMHPPFHSIGGSPPSGTRYAFFLAGKAVHRPRAHTRMPAPSVPSCMVNPYNNTPASPRNARHFLYPKVGSFF